mgnify:CR=1 FL=1
MKKVRVKMLDEDGAVRAWAVGPLDQIVQVKEVALKKLEQYIEKKKEVSDPLAFDEYTMTTQTFSVYDG